uniref:SFRICE_017416 n=1 Tax=Spodoptera frugiperda TaxID=7108 RepID=A0A2H1WV02_SPOFR
MAYFGYMTSKIATSMIKRTDLRSMAGGVKLVLWQKTSMMTGKRADLSPDVDKMLTSKAIRPGHTKCQYLVVACVTTLNVQWATDGMTGIHKVTSP